jgi:hypothetical protein
VTLGRFTAVRISKTWSLPVWQAAVHACSPAPHLPTGCVVHLHAVAFAANQAGADAFETLEEFFVVSGGWAFQGPWAVLHWHGMNGMNRMDADRNAVAAVHQD